jgi:hypothetical protein
MYQITIYRANDGEPVVDIEIAKEAVAGTGIEVEEPTELDGNWLVVLPSELVKPLEDYGYIEMDTNGFEIRGDWSA